MAYINKARSAQLAENELEKRRALEEKMIANEENERLRKLRIQEEEEEERREALGKIRYQRELDQQLIEKQIERNKAFEEFIEEKKQIDAIIAKVKQERRDKIIDQMVKKEVQKEDILHFIEAQKVFETLEQERVEKENAEIAHFLKQKSVWIQQQEESEKRRRSLKNEATLKLAERIRQEEQEKQEREDLLNELYAGRLLEAERQREHQELEVQLRKRLLVKESNELALRLKQEQKQREMADEEAWRKVFMEQMAEQDRIQLMSDRKRRMKQLEHRKECERLIEEQRKKREDEKRTENELWAQQKAEEAALDQVVQEERLKLLQSHAEKLIGFLPGKCLTDSDLEQLSDNVRKAFQSSNNGSDALAELEAKYC